MAFGTALAGAGACVRVDPGPNGVASARLDAVPPSIVLGDVLRDSAGAEVRLAVAAFDEAGRPVANPPLRFTYVPTLRDTNNRLVNDGALVVDSLTGAVRAAGTRVRDAGVVAVRVGDRLQLLDTIDIVRRPDSAAAGPLPVPRLTFSCADPGTALFRADSAADSVRVRNASRAFGVTVVSDSGGVRSRLVRWSVVSPAVPAVRTPGGAEADTLPAVSVVDSATGSTQRLDTTDAAGRSAVRLRVRAPGLGPSVIATDTFTVTVRGIAQPGATPVRGGTVTVRVPVLRQAAPAGVTSYCR